MSWYIDDQIMCTECGYRRGRHAGSCERLKLRLCRMAIKRHRIVWQWCGSNPATWPLHEMQIIAVYGISTFEAALGLGEQ